MKLASITGIEKAIANLEVHKVTKVAQLSTNLYQAGKFLQKVSQEIVPIDTQALHDSAFTLLIPAGMFTNVVVGYNTSYAVRVHEDLDMRHGARFNQHYASEIAQGREGYTMKRPDEQAKFLEKPARDHQGTILAIVMKGMSI